MSNSSEKRGLSQGARRPGFSLIEVSLALMVLVVILGGAFGIFGQVLRSNRVSEQRLIALNLARERLEEYSAPFDSIAHPVGTSTEAYGAIPDYPSFKRVTVVSDSSYYPAPPPDSALFGVAVTVMWDQDRQSEGLATLVSDY
jgi:prepilin-type N-terminal cleavage/methylation domain-containing protein